MRVSWLRHRNTRISFMFIAVGVLFGLLYPLTAREYNDPIAFINGMTIGLLGGAFLSISELYLHSPLKRKMKFFKKVILKTLVYTSFFILLILLVFSFNRSLYNGENYTEYLQGEEFHAFVYHGDFHVIILYTLLISAGLIFTHQISNKMGQGVLLNLIFGKYHTPRKEKRIFMFLDLNDSTTIAEKMGEIRYNQFLNEFFYDITDAILNTYGRIYRYVGDEMVVTWKMKDGIRNINCLRAFQQVKGDIRKHREKYLKKYGIVPQFTAGFHCGQVIVGQVGDVKSQIVFSGKVLYEGAQIEKSCKKFQTDHLISKPLMDQLSLPAFFEKVFSGTIQTNHSKNIELFTVKTN